MFSDSFIPLPGLRESIVKFSQSPQILLRIFAKTYFIQSIIMFYFGKVYTFSVKYFENTLL